MVDELCRMFQSSSPRGDPTKNYLIARSRVRMEFSGVRISWETVAVNISLN
jgi:hypothetical protein